MAERNDGWTQELQDKINPFIGPVWEVTGQLDGWGDIGWSPSDQAVELYFCGPLPAELDPVIADMERAGVGFRKIDIAHGAKEMQAATHVLGDELRRLGIAWSSIGPADLTFSSLGVSGPQVSDDPHLQQIVLDAARRVIGNLPITFTPFRGYASMRPLRKRKTTRPDQ